MKVCCVYSLESPQRGDSNEYIQYTISQYEKKNPQLFQICSYGIWSKGPKNEFETAVVNEPSVFEPLKFYCTCIWSSFHKNNGNVGFKISTSGSILDLHDSNYPKVLIFTAELQMAHLPCLTRTYWVQFIQKLTLDGWNYVWLELIPWSQACSIHWSIQFSPYVHFCGDCNVVLMLDCHPCETVASHQCHTVFLWL